MNIKQTRQGIVLPIALMAFAIVSFLLLVFLAVKPSQDEANNNFVGCTLEAKLCPDGSAVGRTGPNCEFAECPGVNTNANVANGNSNTNVGTDETTEWKTYTNSRFGASGEAYSFRYPADWKVSDYDPQYVRVSPPNQTTNEKTTPVTINIDYIVVPGQLPVQKIDDPKQVNINGVTSTQGTLSGRPDQFIAEFSVTNGVLQISWVKNESSDEVHKRILSTLIFTSPTAGWNTYTNSNYKFSFKYPPDWMLTKGGTCPSSISIPCLLVYTEYKPSGEVYGRNGDVTVNVTLIRQVSGTLESWFTANEELTASKIQDVLDKVAAGEMDVGPGYGSQEFSNVDRIIDKLPAIMQYIKATQPAYIEGPAFTSKIYYVLQNGNIYKIAISAPTGSQSEERIKTGDHLVYSWMFNN